MRRITPSTAHTRAAPSCVGDVRWRPGERYSTRLPNSSIFRLDLPVIRVCVVMVELLLRDVELVVVLLLVR
eukprot:770271-Heterocapsa_arctica.AAC.1